MARDIGFEPMMTESESVALPLGESRIKNYHTKEIKFLSMIINKKFYSKKLSISFL